MTDTLEGTMIVTPKDKFHAELARLQSQFDAMQPELEVTVRDSYLNVEGYVVVWNTAISLNGPLVNCAKGGTRIKPGVSLDEVRMLARNMAIKNSAAGLPLGGCKSGLNADPQAPGFEQQYRRFFSLCKPFTHENGGCFGGFGFDLGAAPEHAIWACDELGSTRSFTGKTVGMGGTDYDREGIAGLGVAESAMQLLRLHRQHLSHTTFSLHGAGAMGAAVLRYFSEYGAQLGSLGDPKYGGTWRFDKPLSVALFTALISQNTNEAQTLIASEAQHISDDANACLFAEVDVLFPCAVQHVISRQNFNNIRARYIVEGANNPTVIDAYPLLFAKGVHHIPDFIANVGGVIAAYVELVTGLNGKISNEENARTRAKVIEAKTTTRSTIQNNIVRIHDISVQHKVSLRDAGLYLALKGIFGDDNAANSTSVYVPTAQASYS
jgi:glutamate dehydrogenase (NAD(P)+)